MTKLTDTQLIILSRAAARDDGFATSPEKMTKAAATKVGASLLARKLMREVRSKLDMPVWRQDQDGRSISLVITKAGRKAIGTEDADDVPAKSRTRGPVPVAVPTASTEGGAATTGGAPRAGSKQALVIRMLSAGAGTTIDALVEATGWLPHTTRAALTGLRKRGFSIERSRQAGQGSSYRLTGPADQAA